MQSIQPTPRRQQKMSPIAIALVFVLAFALRLHAQTTNGQITGRVVDSSGAAIPEAAVEVVNDTTGQVRTATSAGDGAYTVPQLPPGIYDVSAVKQGFASQKIVGLKLDVSQSDLANFTMGVSSVNTAVSVDAGAPLLDTANGHISEVVDAEQIVDLPLNGRSFTQLILLTPGAAPRGSDQQGAFTISIGGGSISPSVNGQRAQQNNFTMDGVENNSLFINSFALSPPPDAQQEFAVTSHITDAQFAISSGANINVVTKSGTKSYHGAAWEFIRNNKLDALQDTPNRDVFSQVASQPYHLNQYGLQFDGPFPLLRKSTWFSGYWEGARIAQTTSGITNVPTAAERTGDFSDILGAPTNTLDGNGHMEYTNEIFDPYTQVFSASGTITRQPLGGYDATGKPKNSFVGVYPINAASQAITAKYLPTPNITGVNSLNGNYSYPNLNSTKSDQHGIRIDHRFRNNDLLFGRYNRANANRVVAQSIDTLINDSQNYARQAVVGYTHLFGTSTLLDLRYAYSKTTVQVDDAPAGTALINAVNWENVQPIKNATPLGPQTYLRGGPFLQQQALPLGPQTTNQGNVDVSMTKGRHTIGYGGFVYNLHSFADGWHVGAYFFGTSTSADGGWGPTGNGFAGFLLGSIDRFEGSVGDTSADVTTLWRGGYVQDQWKATSKLTLTAGLRYDYVPPPTYTAVTSNLDPATGQFQISRPEPQVGYPNRIGPENTFYPQYNGLQPRFGLAYAATDKTVVRGAFALLDDHNNSLVQQGQDIRQAFPRAASYFVENVWSDPSHTLRPATNSADVNHTQFIFGVNETAASQLLMSSTPTIGFAVDPHAHIPYSMEYNLGIEQQLTKKSSLTIDYVGSQSRHLFIQAPFNGPQIPGTSASSTRGIPFPAFGQYQQDLNAGTSNYNALQVKVKQANLHGLNFLASYTWSKSLDEQSEGQSGTITNIYDLRRDYGPSDFDYRHLFSLSGIYQLPFGKGKEYYANASKPVDLLIGGWNVGSIFYAKAGGVGQLQCGDTGGLGEQWGRCNVVPGVARYIHSGPSGTFLNPKAYAQPAPGTLGNEGRNDWHNPPSWNEDVSLFKDFHVIERLTFQFRAEAFNVFNTPNLSVGGNYQFSNPSTLGRLQSAGSPREIQFAGKIIF